MSFKSLLNTTCTIQAVSTSINAMGEVIRSYTTGTSFDCRLDPVGRLGETEIANREGIVTRRVLFLESTTAITETNRIQSGGSYFNVLQVNPLIGMSGQHHKEVLVERIS